MLSPLPIPSKAAIRVLRGIVFGTSCAIGAIVEDRRQRISMLKTVVANKEKLRSSRRYHRGDPEIFDSQLDDAVVLPHKVQWHEMERAKISKHHDVGVPDRIVPTNSVFENKEPQTLYNEEKIPDRLRIPPPSPIRSPPLHPITFNPHTSPIVTRQEPTLLADRTTKNSQVTQQDPSAALLEKHSSLLRSIGNALASKEKKGLDRTIAVVMSNVPAIPSSPLVSTWLRLSARLSKECQASGRWEDASKILTAIISLGPLHEAKYFAHDPLPIIEFHLRRPNPETPCSEESVASAAKLFLAEFPESPKARGTDMERIGKVLMLEAVSLRRFNLTHRVYWRIMGWADDPEAFVRWAIHTFFEHKDYKNVIKIFLLHYSHMAPSAEHFHETLDCVVGSIEALKGLRAISVLEAFTRIECPKNAKFRATWIIKLLRSHWARFEDLYQTAELFKKVASLIAMGKISHPQAIYGTVVDIAVSANNEELAQSHAEMALRAYPDMASDIALKLVLFKAKAGDWESVLETFRQVRRGELSNPASYDNAFIPVLKVWAESHSATETRDLALLFIRDLGVKFHRYMVTLVANKLGKAHDVEGFMAWLRLCSQEGFALDPGFCNSVLYNCWATWKFSFPELRMIHARMEALNPHCSDEVTRRILSQAAHREGRGYSRMRPKAIVVNRMAYSGRSVNKRDIYEAMNQELMNNKPASAVVIYKRAMRYGMPFCSHCLRLAVLAAFRRKRDGDTHALSMIREAHIQGHEVEPAVSTLIKCEVNAFLGSVEDMIVYMQRIVSRLESSRIAVRPGVLTHMAATCSKIGQHQKAIALCNIARDRSGSSQVCFSKQSFQVLATAYAQLWNVGGFKSLVDSLFKSKFSTDKVLLLHLKSVGRRVRMADRSNARTALLDIIEDGIHRLTEARGLARAQGKLIGQETIHIIGDALAELQKNEEEGYISQGSIEPLLRSAAME